MNMKFVNHRISVAEEKIGKDALRLQQLAEKLAGLTADGIFHYPLWFQDIDTVVEDLKTHYAILNTLKSIEHRHQHLLRDEDDEESTEG